MKQSAGVLLFLAGVIIFLGITTAEIFYPNYNTRIDFISDLGSSKPPHSIIKEPSAAIFDISLIVAGLFIILGAYILHKAKLPNYFTFSLYAVGLGTFGVGVFPAFHAVLHPFVAFIAFFFAGISALLSKSVIKGPLSYISVAIGIIVLVFLLLGVISPELVIPIFGIGGAERWIAYPSLLWLIGYGGYLMSASIAKK